MAGDFYLGLTDLQRPCTITTINNAKLEIGMKTEVADKIIELDNTIVKSLNVYEYEEGKKQDKEAIRLRMEQGYSEPLDEVSYNRILWAVSLNGRGKEGVIEAWESEDWRGIWEKAFEAIEANKVIARSERGKLPSVEELEAAVQEVAALAYTFWLWNRGRAEVGGTDVQLAQALIEKHWYIVERYES